MKRNLFLAAVLCIFNLVQAQIINYSIQSEKTYPDNTRTCYFEIDNSLSRQQKKFAMEQAQSNKNLLDLYFYEDNEHIAMFSSVVEWNVDSVVNFINDAAAQYSVQNIADEVRNTAMPAYAPAVTADACDNIIPITACGAANTQTAVLSGSGSWNGNPCWSSSPGQEKIYSFTPAVTGNYNLVVTSGNGYVDYLWSTSCSSSGWTCIDYFYGNGTHTIGTLTAGTTYYFLLDSESTSSTTHSFYISCATGGGTTDCSGVLTQPNGCIDAEPFCSSDEYCFAASTSVSAYGSISCLGSTPGPAWYWLEIDQPGNLQIYIEQRTPSGVGVDVDFVCWGPFNSVADACAQKNNTNYGSCHSNNCGYPYGNIVDCCFCGLYYENLYINNAQTGQVYLLLLTNYSRQVANISFSQSGGTSTTNCGIITPPASNNGPLCVGDTLQLTAQTSNVAGAVYNWTGPNGFTSNLQNPTINSVTTASAGVYSLIITTSTETGNPETTTVVVNVPSDTTFINEQICENYLPYAQNGFNVSTAGVYFLDLVNVSGCDSIVKLDLTINPIYRDTVSPIICEGNFYTFNSVDYYNTILHSDTLPTINGCDSILTLNLMVNPVIRDTVSEAICFGSSFHFGGNDYSVAGFYSDTLQTSQNCDSISVLILTVNPVYSDTAYMRTICEGDNITGYSCISCPDFSTLPAGEYFFTDTLHTVNNCDSLVTLGITVNSVYNDTVYQTICEGDLGVFHCITCPDFSNLTAGEYFFTDTLHTVNNCDSLVTLNLTVNQVYNDTVRDTICYGEDYNSYGFNLPNIQNDTVLTKYLQTVLTCDSIVTLNLTVKPYLTRTFSKTICDIESYDFYGQMLTVSDTYIDTIPNISGCDSIITLNLTVRNCDSISVEPLHEICADDGSFLVNFQTSGRIPECFSVNFPQNAKNAGFVDIVCENINGNSLEIPLPKNICPNNYSMELIFEYENNLQKTANVNFTVLYATSVMQQKWNDVIALKNAYYNGGYEFSAYRWYKDMKEIVGEIRSYIYLGEEEFDFVSEYRALLTRASDGITLFTCPLVPEKHTEISKFPTIVTSGNTITIYFTKDLKEARLWTVTGILLQTQKTLRAPVNQINLPQASGVYLLEIQLDNQQRRVYPVVSN
ncbi:MAG: immunoglobulin domain-containing protein [Prevotellaceae bacterium]|jgi:hypothetical protein|nr:immunoglobulin domain-containing protein [Prevotellaceae bacterium]